jgi:hypothetical protein
MRKTTCSLMLTALLTLGTPALAQTPAATVSEVTLVIDKAPSDETQTKVPWQSGMTVEEVLQLGAPRPAQGPAYVAQWYPGFGSYLVTAIGNMANSGSDNWIYCVGPSLMPLGMNRIIVSAGDVVTFRYLDTSQMDHSSSACPER